MRIKLNRRKLALCFIILCVTILLTSSPRYFDQRDSDITRLTELVDCNLLFEGDRHEQSKIRTVLQTKDFTPLSDSRIRSLATNCPSLKSNYIVKSTTTFEADYAIAFSILTHENAQQLEYLLRHIYRPQNVYCIHVDFRSPSSFHAAIRQICRCFDNVFIASRLENVTYAGFSRLQADLNCMSDLLKRREKWNYAINLVGSVFPLKTNLEMVKIFKLYNGNNDIEGMLPNAYHRTRFDVSHVAEYSADGKPYMARTIIKKSPPPHNLTIVKGSAFGVFSRQFLHFIFTDKKARDLLEWSRDTLTPDEHFWATLHHIGVNPQLNSPGGFKGDPKKKKWLATYAAWPPWDECFGVIVHGVCVFGVGDLPNLLTRKEFFANKFSVKHDPAALVCMSSWIRSKVNSHLPVDLNYYRQLSFIAKDTHQNKL